jgi:hypothetical protein
MSWSDTTPAPNVSGTHSYLAVVRRTDRIPLWHCGAIRARAKLRVGAAGLHKGKTGCEPLFERAFLLWPSHAHLPRAGPALLRQDPNRRKQRGTLVLHRARSRRCRLAKSEGLTSPTLRNWPALGAVGGGLKLAGRLLWTASLIRGRHWPVVKPIFRAVRERYRPMIPAAKSDALSPHSREERQQQSAMHNANR